MAPAIHRDFDADRNDEPDEPGPSFTLAGQEFRCVPNLPFHLLAETARNATGSAPTNDAERNERGAKAIIVIADLFDQIIVDEDLGAWHTVLADKRHAPSLEQLRNISQWLIGEAYTGRPTQPPSDSLSQPESGGTTSTDSSSSPAILEGQPA